MNGSTTGVKVAPGVEAEVGGSGLRVDEGGWVGVSDGEMVRVIGGGEVCVSVGGGKMNGYDKLPQNTVAKRMNIIIKMRRMDIL